SDDMIYEFDYEGKFVFANKATLKRTGYEKEELEKMTCWDLMDPDYKQEVKKYYLEQIGTGRRAINSEFPIVNKSGERIWLNQSVGCTISNGRPIKLHAISRDITELIETRVKLKESEERIRAEKNLLKTMVSSSPAAIAMFSKDFNYLAYSGKWSTDKDINEKLINEKLIGLDVDVEGENSGLDSTFDRILNGEVIKQENDLILTENGEERWVKWVATPWKNTADDSIGGVIVYTDDVTQIMHHKKELQQAKEEAEKSGKIKEDFLSSMSHEIRTPLNAIIGTTNLLMEENKELAENEKFKLLKFSSNNLLALINNVLDFSKIESGKIHLENKDFEIRELANSLVNSWIPVAQQKDIALKLKIDDQIAEVVNGDAVRLSQVMNNLINNAIKFTTEGMVQVKLEKKEGDMVYFEVRDTGIGIPESKLDLVFESFEQVTSQETFNVGGTGLGLPICKKLVDMMGAQLHLSSQEGFGSVFSFSIPLKEGTPLNTSESSTGSSQKQLEIEVLLVEDNQANQFIAKSFLDKWGVKLKIANNGKEAIEAVKSKTFDVVLMDMRMPVMDGFTAAKHIRAMEDAYFQKVPIIALTASTMLDIRKSGSGQQFDGYLGKPFNPKELYNLLANYSKTSNEVVAVEESLSTEEVSQKEVLHEAANACDELIKRLEEYTEGDPDFLVQFSQNILNNLEMTKKSVIGFFEGNEVDLDDLTHTIKPSLEIIGDTGLLKKMNEIRSGLPQKEPDANDREEVLELIGDHIKRLNGVIEKSSEPELMN
ncbi:MAG: ATP-binding protein, partial [Bacteroidota bacterium]